MKSHARLLVACTSAVIGALSLSAYRWVGARAQPERRVRSRNALQAAAVGCWKLYDNQGHSAQGSLYWSPAITQLDSTLAQSRPASPILARNASRLDTLGHDISLIDDSRNRGTHAWSSDSLSDSVRIGFSSGFSGTVFVLKLEPTLAKPDTLFGRAFEHWDSMGPPNFGITERREATAIRTPCAQ